MGRRSAGETAMVAVAVMVVAVTLCDIGWAQDWKPDSCHQRCDELPSGLPGCTCDPHCKGRRDCCSDYDDLCITITRGDVPDDFEPSVDDDDDYPFIHPEADVSHEEEGGRSPPPREEVDRERGDGGDGEDEEEGGEVEAAPGKTLVPPLVTLRPSTLPVAPPPSQHYRPPQRPPPSESTDRRPGFQQPHVASIPPARHPTPPHQPSGEGPGLPAAGGSGGTAAGGRGGGGGGPTVSTGTRGLLKADLCSKEPFNAFMTTPNGTVLAFRGEYFWELFPVSGAPPSAPRLIEEVWGVTPPIDAAFTRMNCEAFSYIFKGDKYWRFSGGTLDRGFPRSITRGFPRVPTAPDAAFAVPSAWRSQEHAYFFKGGQYYKYVFRQQPSARQCRRRGATMAPHSRRVSHPWDAFVSRLFSARHDHCYPRDTVRSWRGVPTRLDAVMTSPYPATPHSGIDVYFYSGDSYYRVDLLSRRVRRATPPYPRSIAQYWLGCSVM